MFYTRKVLMSDYDDIVDISKDIWGGTDYLPWIFKDWVNDENGAFICVCDSDKNGKVVGVDKYTILYDHTGWLEGLRVHKNYRGLKLSIILAEKVLEVAKKDLACGKINKIAFSTHITNVESISLMSKYNFKLEQEQVMLSKSGEKIKTKPPFTIEKWDISLHEFMELDYLKKRNNLVPLAFVFQSPTEELYQKYKKEDSFVQINGHKGIVVSKSGEQYFIAIEDTFDAIDVFMDCLLAIKTSENYMEPMTFVLPENRQVIEEALKSGYSVYENGKPDYLYYVLKGMPPC